MADPLVELLDKTTDVGRRVAVSHFSASDFYQSIFVTGSVHNYLAPESLKTIVSGVGGGFFGWLMTCVTDLHSQRWNIASLMDW